MKSTMDYTLLDFQPHGDDRGQLTVIESGKDIPFDVERVFYIYSVEGDVRRGFHALRDTDQVLVCVRGRCKILLDDGTAGDTEGGAEGDTTGDGTAGDTTGDGAGDGTADDTADGMRGGADGGKVVVSLDDPQKGLLVPAHLWREMFDFSPDAMLLVLASGPYAESDYIRNYEDFLAYTAELRKTGNSEEID